MILKSGKKYRKSIIVIRKVKAMKKNVIIAIVGAGSYSFGRGTVQDIFLSDALNDQGVELRLMDIEAGHLAGIERYARAVAGKLNRRAAITTTRDLDTALKDADFVVVSIEVNRYFYWSQDFHVPRKYGFLQVFGENGGPGGMFHALRNMGPMLHIARRMEEFCPAAWLLNFTNPEAKLCEMISRLTKVKVVGLCHGIFYGRNQLARMLELPVEDLETTACGLNHFGWFQIIRHRKTGEDLYPVLRQKERQANWLASWDCLALSRIMMRTFGLWPYPGANHNGEYVRWAEDFLASSRLNFFYDPREGHPWETGHIPDFVYSMEGHPTDTSLYGERYFKRVLPDFEKQQEKQEDLSKLDLSKLKIGYSGELAISIMEAVARGIRHELPAVNIPNQGAIAGLPDDMVVEIPVTMTDQGIHRRQLAPLPEAITAMIHIQGSIHKLLIEAFVEQSRNKLLQAVLLDPTASSYRNAVAMINELCELQKNILPPLQWRE